MVRLNFVSIRWYRKRIPDMNKADNTATMRRKTVIKTMFLAFLPFTDKTCFYACPATLSARQEIRRQRNHLGDDKVTHLWDFSVLLFWFLKYILLCCWKNHTNYRYISEFQLEITFITNRCWKQIQKVTP